MAIESPTHAQLLLDRGACLDHDGSGFTALMAAASVSSAAAVGCVRLLLAAGAKANATQSQRMTALMLAAKGGSLDVVGELARTPGIELDLREEAAQLLYFVHFDTQFTNVRIYLI